MIDRSLKLRPEDVTMDTKILPNLVQYCKSYGDIFLGILMGVASVYGLWLCAGLLIALLA
jgi:hypothetical protein